MLQTIWVLALRTFDSEGPPALLLFTEEPEPLRNFTCYAACGQTNAGSLGACTDSTCVSVPPETEPASVWLSNSSDL